MAIALAIASVASCSSKLGGDLRSKEPARHSSSDDTSISSQQSGTTEPVPLAGTNLADIRNAAADCVFGLTDLGSQLTCRTLTVTADNKKLVADGLREGTAIEWLTIGVPQTSCQINNRLLKFNCSWASGIVSKAPEVHLRVSDSVTNTTRDIVADSKTESSQTPDPWRNGGALRYFFVTASLYASGPVIAGFDKACTDEAAQSTFPDLPPDARTKHWRALIAMRNESAFDRFGLPAAVSVLRPDGEQLAASLDQFKFNDLMTTPDLTALGLPVAEHQEAWFLNANPGQNSENCTDWTFTGVGLTPVASTNVLSTDAGFWKSNITTSCQQSHRLYCLSD